MAKRVIRLGVIVPSSNAALEPLTQAMISSIRETDLEVSVHFARIRVTQISLSADSDAQFDINMFLEAARLLADAEVQVIGWSGTAAGWMGFATDDKLCATIKKETGIPATTSVMGLNRVLDKIGAKELGLVTPYTGEMNERIRKNYGGVGIDIPAEQERHLGGMPNVQIAKIGEDVLDEMVESVAKAGAKVLTTFCTNLTAAQRVDHWEETYDVTVLDSVATVVWDMLQISIGRPGLVKGWGRMMSN
jgi:maleate isomerase